MSIIGGIVKGLLGGEPNTPEKKEKPAGTENETPITEQPTPEQQTSEGINPQMKKEVLNENVERAEIFAQQPTEEQPTEEQTTDEQPTSSSENVDILAVANGTTDTAKKVAIEYENVPVAIREQEKAIVKLAAQIVANQEVEKNLAILSETLANMPPALFPQATEIVASTLIDAKDGNGNRIWNDKNEIIEMLKKLKNAKSKKQSSKYNRGGRGGGKRGGKKVGEKPRENDYLDYMMTKRINPAILITPRMK